MTRGPEHVVELLNPVAQELLGARELLGRPICEALPEIVAKGLAELLDHTYRCGEPYVDPPQCVLLERDGQLVECWFDVEYAPLREPGGGVDGLVIRAVEIIEQVRATRGRVPRAQRPGPAGVPAAPRKGGSAGTRHDDARVDVFEGAEPDICSPRVRDAPADKLVPTSLSSRTVDSAADRARVRHAGHSGDPGDRAMGSNAARRVQWMSCSTNGAGPRATTC